VRSIERTREMKASPGGQGDITRIVVRYADGRVLYFVPDASREAFSEDDILELKKMLDSATSAAEWADVNTDRSL
jgi:hypothetical protein